MAIAIALSGLNDFERSVAPTLIFHGSFSLPIFLA